MANKQDLERLRKRTIKEAWKLELERVEKGYQTNDWTDEEIEELKKNKKIKGYEGHHMQSVSAYPEQAGNPNNIQWLPTPKDESTGKKDRSIHLNAHGGNYQNPTNGYFDYKTGKTIAFEEGETPSIEKFAKPIPSSSKYAKQKNEAETTPVEGAFFMSKTVKGEGKMDIGEKLGSISSSIGPLTEALSLMDNLGVSTEGLTEGFAAFQTATELVTIAQTALNLVMSMNPIGMVVLAIGAVIAALVLLWNNCEGFREAVIAVWEAIQSAGEVVWNALCTFFTETVPAAVQVLVDCFNSFVEFWSGIFASIGEFFMDCWNSIIAFATETVPAFIDTVVTFISELPGKIWEWLVNVVTNVTAWISDMVTKAQEEVPKFIEQVIVCPPRKNRQ